MRAEKKNKKEKSQHSFEEGSIDRVMKAAFLQVIAITSHLLRRQKPSERSSFRTPDSVIWSPKRGSLVLKYPKSPKEGSRVVKTEIVGKKHSSSFSHLGGLGHKHLQPTIQATLTVWDPCSNPCSVLQIGNRGGASTFIPHCNIRSPRVKQRVTIT